MKVLFVQHDAHLQGGTGQVLLQLTRGLRKFGVECLAVFPEDGELQTDLHNEGVKTFVVRADVFSGWRPEGGHWYLAGLSSRVAQYREIIESEDVDIVHTNTIFVLEGALAAIQSTRPHIWHLHNSVERDSVPAYLKAIPIVDDARGQFLNWLSDGIVAVSRDTADSVNSADTAKVQVIHNGLDIADFDKRCEHTAGAELRRTLGLDANARLVGSVARITRQKNLKLFVESAQLILERIPESHFLIIGPPDDAEYAVALDHWVEERKLQDHIHFLGGRDDIPSLLTQLDVLAVTSDFEGFGLVILEAMAANKPVVATRCGGPEEIIVHGITGFLVDKGNTDSLSDCVTNVLENAELAARLGKAGRERVVREFSADMFAQRFVALYRELQRCDRPVSRDHRLLPAEMVLNVIDHSATLALEQNKLTRRVEAMEAYLSRVESTLLYRVCNTSRKALRKLALRS